MLARSGKSRLAAMALMALGASTFMGTSAAKATGVEVTGSVGTCEVSSTVTASDVSFGSLEPGDYKLTWVTPNITQGKTSDCKPRDSSVTASLGSFSDNATTFREFVEEYDEELIEKYALEYFELGIKVLIFIPPQQEWEEWEGDFLLVVGVPLNATVGQAFSAILTLTLIG
jgi:hypothetical protein